MHGEVQDAAGFAALSVHRVAALGAMPTRERLEIDRQALRRIRRRGVGVRDAGNIAIDEALRIVDAAVHGAQQHPAFAEAEQDVERAHRAERQGGEQRLRRIGRGHEQPQRPVAAVDGTPRRCAAVGIAAGVPKVTAATSDMFVPQALNWDLLGGVSFQKGCYTGQEIVARMQYLGRLKERLYAFRTHADEVKPAARLYSAAFGDQACGTVVNAAPDPAGGSALLAVAQREAADAGDVRLGALDGLPLSAQRLPYAVPAATEPRVPRKL